MLNYFPNYISRRAIVLYFALLVLIPLVFWHPMAWYFWAFGIIEVCVFFYFGNILSRQWVRESRSRFTKNMFWYSFAIRAAFVIITYFLYPSLNNSYFEFGAADSYTYHLFGERGAEMIAHGQFDFRNQFNAMGFFSRGLDIADTGYPVYLSFIYFISGKSIVFARLVKALLSSVTVVLAYRIACRNFGERAARVTAVFCMLMPNLIYYCGAHVKETEMLFLTMLFMDRADILVRSPKRNWGRIFECALLCFTVYFFRAVLSIVLALALVAALLFSSESVSSRVRRFSLVGLLVLLFGTVFWNVLSETLALDDYDNIQAQQEQNMQWRAERENGNTYAKYAGAAVFAPLIFTIPFPTMVNIPNQESQQMIHGGNYVKNITSFFTILALILLLMSGKWRERVLPIAFLCGYLVVLVFSNYAQSERFHIPILPFSLMLAAYGITEFFGKKHVKWFTLWLAFIFVVNIGWSWFKLRGRGM